MSTATAPRPARTRRPASPARLRAAAYTRISDDPKLSKIGVENQEVSCRRLADALGADVLAHFEDNDLTAAKPDKIVRPAFEALLSAIGRGEFDLVVYVHYDRLLRTRKDFDRLVEAALAGKLKRIIGVRSGEIDLSTAAGQMMGAIMASLGHYEVQHMVERQQDAARRRAERGKVWTPCRVFGYTKADSDGGMKLDRAEAKVLRKLYSDVLAGRSMQGLARELNTKGVKTSRGGTWKATTLREVIMAPRNAGLRAYKGEIVAKGDRPAIVQEHIWRGAVDKLSDPKRVKRPKGGWGRKYLLTGLIHCGTCNATMSGSTHTTGHAIYVCRKCRKVSRSVVKLDNHVLDLVSERLSRPDAAELLVSRQREDIAALGDKANALRARRDEIASQLTDLDIPVTTVKSALADIGQQIAEVEAKMSDPNKMHIFAGVIGARNVRGKLDKLALDRRRAVVAALLTITVHPGQASRGELQLDLLPPTWKE